MLPALLLYAGSISWVIGYDTIYAHQDREDDALIGIKSTALLFGAAHQADAGAVLRPRGHSASARPAIPPAAAYFRARAAAFAAHLGWQIVRLDIADPGQLPRVFKSDRDAGLILFAGLLLDAALHHLAS